MEGSFFTRRLRRGQLIALDALAGAIYTLALPVLPHSSDVVSWERAALAAGVGLPLALRRLWPLPVFGFVLAVSVLGVLLQVVRDPLVAASFAVYPVALSGLGRRWVPTPAIGVFSAAGLLMLPLAGGPAVAPYQVSVFLVGAVVMGAAWTLGTAVRERRAHTAQLADQAVAEERLRIARELHDVVAHSMSLIAVKAAIANHVSRVRPEEANDALQVIETTSRDALAEMRHLLGVLRSTSHETCRNGTQPAFSADLSPSPGLADLAGLAERAAMAGVHIDLRVDGVDGLPEGVELSAYRIVQEAVTNVVKHAAPARCRIDVVSDGREVSIEVTDNGPGHRVLPGSIGGHGLVGMRERVAMFGGTLAAGPRPEGGFGVSARLPLDAVT